MMKLLQLALAMGVLLLSACSDNPPEGDELYADFCASCHGGNNEGTLSFQNPNSIPPVIDQTVTGITDALFDVPAMDRPDLNSLTVDEVRAIADFMGTIGPDGQALYSSLCSTCHGPNNEGGTQNPIPATGLTVNEIELLMMNAISGGIPLMAQPNLEALTLGEVTAIAIHVFDLSNP